MRFFPHAVDALKKEMRELQKDMERWPSWSAQYKSFEGKARQIAHAIDVLEQYQLQAMEQ